MTDLTLAHKIRLLRLDLSRARQPEAATEAEVQDLRAQFDLCQLNLQRRQQRVRLAALRARRDASFPDRT